MELPSDPIAAVTHPDPYPYYAELAARTPLYRDDTLGLWIAASAEAVTAVLMSDVCRVRPPAEPIPRHLLGTPVADIFRLLVRMDDGAGHRPFKRAIAATLASIDAGQVAERGRAWARALADELRPDLDPERLEDYAFRLPVYVVAGLLGIADDQLPAVASWTGDFVRCLAPGTDPAHLARGATAASHLLATFRALLADHRAGHAAGLLSALSREGARVGRGAGDIVVANAIGFLSQSYEATAGLIGNTLVALARHPEVREAVSAGPGQIHALIREVLHRDPPIQNTRRFVARDGTVAGQELREGDAILVVLAAANRDPAAHPQPGYFAFAGDDRRSWAFGTGGHACPGDALSTTIAAAGVAQLLASGLAPERLRGAVTYRASVNARVPRFAVPQGPR